MQPSTKGVVDVVFCLDASGSMAPCIDGVRRNVGAFLDGLAGDANRKIDCRMDFLAHSCDEAGQLFRSESSRWQNQDLISRLYSANTTPADFFTTEPSTIRSGLDRVAVYGDEAMLVALDLALDFPWRLRAGCHRVVVMLTDEPMESNAPANGTSQASRIGEVIDKIHALGVMLFLVGPKSAGLDELAEADKSQYQQVQQAEDGLGSLDFARVLAHVGKSVSVANPQGQPERPVRRALFGQDRWVASGLEIKGGK